MVEVKFIEYINERIKDGQEFDAIIGDVDMPATFGFCDDCVITDYCIKLFGELLNSEIVEHIDTTGHCTTSVEVLYDNHYIGEQFCWAVAGYISDSEWNKLFTKEGDIK